MDTARNHGLDVVRATAITMVLGGHVLALFMFDFPVLKMLHLVFASAGVDVFFALSGFLIGGILLRDLAADPSPRGLARFWTRRWFRTLPNYYVWLSVHAVAVAASHDPLPPIGHYYLFIQNILNPPYWFFNVSWSLAVEEWFYLLLPLALVAVRATGRSWKTSSLFALTLLGAISFALRVYASLLPNPLMWDLMRKPVTLRFDALMAGVLAAHLQTFAPRAWASLARPGPGIAAALGGFYFATVMLLDLDHSIFAKTVVIVMIPVATFFALPAVVRCGNGGIFRRPVRAVSDWAYSIYLIHPTILIFLSFDFGGDDKLSVPMKAVFALTWIGITLAVAALNFRVFEDPVKNLRDVVWRRPRLIPVES